MPLKTTPEGGESTEEQIKEFAARTAPPWMVSAVFHMVVLIVLGIWMVVPNSSNSIFLVATSEKLDQLDMDTLEIDSPEPIETSEMLPPVEDPFAAPPEMAVNLDLNANVMTSSIDAPAGIALKGRTPGYKARMLGKYGGNDESDKAVQDALTWLARQQQKDGTWSLKGPYEGGSNFENIEAATAMALLAFQGDGNTHRQGKFKTNVDRGIKALLKSQDAEGSFFQADRRDEWLYTQAQCTIALCELYAMTGDSELRLAAERAVKFCIDAQSPNEENGGGWRYRPRVDSDTSVTGWMVMALQSARMAGIEVPEKTFALVNQFLDNVSAEEGSRYAYLIGQLPDRVMTAEALLCRQYLGWEQNDDRLARGVEYLTSRQNLPDWGDRDAYYWYYGTQVMHHMEGDAWKTWNGIMRDMLVEKQVDSGREKGSWDPMGPSPDRWCQLGHGGRLYVTCLHVYNLEVYYRHMPLYSELTQQLKAAANK